MNLRVAVIFLFSVLLPVVCLALIFSYKADLVLYLAVAMSSVLMSVICLARVARMRKLWSENVQQMNSKLFFQTVISGGTLPVLLIFMYHLFSGFNPSSMAYLEWSEGFRESAIAAIMFGMPLWIFSFPWAFGVNYLYMDALQEKKPEAGIQEPE